MKWLTTLVLGLAAFIFVGCRPESPAPKADAASTRKGNSASSLTATTTTTVNIHVIGLCTFVADSDRVDNTPIPMSLRLLNAHNGMPAEHLPILLYPLALQPSKPTDSRAVTAAADRHSWIEFAGEELSFGNQVDAALNPLNYDETSSDCAPAKGASLYFATRLANVIGGANPPKRADLDVRYLASTPDPALVSLATHITFGTLSANVPNPVIWDYKTAAGVSSGHSQQIAQEVIWTFAIPGTQLTVFTRKFSPGEVAKPLMVFNADGGKIDLTVANVPKDHINIIIDPVQFGMHNPPANDPHFFKYYDMITGNVPRFAPVAGGVCANMVASHDRCDARKFVDVQGCPPPAAAPPTSPPPPILVGGGVNCGPDQVP